jgi:hypothetical protein
VKAYTVHYTNCIDTVLSHLQSLEALQSDVVLSCLRSTKPMIHEVVLGPGEFSDPYPSVSLFHNVHSKKDLSFGNNDANANTEIVRVASLSATFEGQCKFMFISMPASLLMILRQCREFPILKVVI